MKKPRFLILAISMLFLVLIATAPVKAVDPTEVTGVWFVAMATSSVPGVTYWTDGDVVYHQDHIIAQWNLLRSPPGTAGSTIIGNVTTDGDVTINTKTQQGTIKVRMTLRFNETNSTKNPYGVGTLQGFSTDSIMSYDSANLTKVGNGTGLLVAASGTGDFANAMLTIDYIRTPYPTYANPTTNGLFFGAHSRVNGSGVLTYNSMQGTYRDWQVNLHQNRVYIFPPGTLTSAPKIISVGTWDQAYYSRFGMTPVDIAKPTIDDLMSSPYMR